MDIPIRVVASYTTLPDRYEVLYKSICSLQEQTHKLDAIYVCVPKKATRLNKEYPPLPENITNACSIINIDTDYGPLTKIYGALVSESDPNTVIISCDDDVIFAPNHVDILLKHHKNHPNCAICGTGALIGRGLLFISIVSSVNPFRGWNGFTGFKVPPDGRKVDLIFGVAGVLYVRKFFPTHDKLNEEILQYSLRDNAVFCNDDVLISGYLSKQKIERRVFIDIPTIHHNDYDVRESALSSNIMKMIMRLNTSIQKVKEYGFFPYMEEVPLDETVAGRVFILIVFLIVIIILCVYLYKGL